MHLEKYRVFIGSSVEGLEVAHAIQLNFEHTCYVDIWTQGVFEPSSSTLDDLIKALSKYDFAIFVFKPEDVSKIRKEEYATVRDNVIFEMGLFIGKLGKDRTFYITPRGEKFHLPTDLIGFNPASYDPNHPNLEGALGAPCNLILRKMQGLGKLT